MAEKKKLGVGGIISIVIGVVLIYKVLTSPLNLTYYNSFAWYWRVTAGLFLMISGFVLAKLMAGDAETFDLFVTAIVGLLMGALMIGGTVYVPVSNFVRNLSKTWQVVLLIAWSLLSTAILLPILIRFDKSSQKKE